MHLQTWMWLIASLLLAPLLGLFNLSLNLSNHWTQSASEQIRLDALTLSLCHSRKSFLEIEISPINTGIQGIQKKMDILAARCLQDPLECGTTLPLLHSLSAQGTFLMRTQDALMVSFAARQTLKMDHLIHENDLAESWGRIENSKSIESGSSGLEREIISAIRLSYESLLQTKWPEALVTKSNFSDVNQYKLIWLPSRKLQNHFAVKAHQVQPRGLAQLSSECHVQDQENKWIVER